jgi:hypothetical protein
MDKHPANGSAASSQGASRNDYDEEEKDEMLDTYPIGSGKNDINSDKIPLDATQSEIDEMGYNSLGNAPFDPP